MNDSDDAVSPYPTETEADEWEKVEHYAGL